AVVIGATVAAASGFSSQLVDDFNTNREVVDTDIDQTTDAFDDGEMNVLVLGSDAREDEEAEEQRSDTMMLVHIPETSDELYVMSFISVMCSVLPNVY